MATAIVSILTGIPVRADVAMTGEITLRGRILPIGGLKEKLLAAHRGGLKLVLIPKENEKDLADIPASIKGKLQIIRVDHMDEVLAAALAIPNVGGFLRDGDHDFDDILEIPPHERPAVEVPVPQGVN